MNAPVASNALEGQDWRLERLAVFPGLRVLAWSNNRLYASRGYKLFSADMNARLIEWEHIADYRPEWWRNFTAKFSLSCRLVRDGFHALTVLGTGHLIAAVPGAIVRLEPGRDEFCVTHQIQRGTRPLHICAVPGGDVYFGEYFDNHQREQVHIYRSSDSGLTWFVAYTFRAGAIRHVHNIVYDRWKKCLWILTGDNGSECQILRASLDLKQVETVISGNQQARAVALVPVEQGIYFSSDTPLEKNHIYFLDRFGKLEVRSDISGSSIYGCHAGNAIFFSTMVEPSNTNLEKSVCLYGSLDGISWTQQCSWEKDRWHPALFQYGNAILPDGDNSTDILAVSTVAVEQEDLSTSVYRITR